MSRSYKDTPYRLIAEVLAEDEVYANLTKAQQKRLKSFEENRVKFVCKIDWYEYAVLNKQQARKSHAEQDQKQGLEEYLDSL